MQNESANNNKDSEVKQFIQQHIGEEWRRKGDELFCSLVVCIRQNEH